MNTKIIEDMEKLDKAIKESKSNKTLLEGRKSEIIKQMKEKFKVDNLEDLSALIEKEEKELQLIVSQIEKDYKEIKTKYNW
jgi:predicted Mrr-cat superfamily restriction endonuclease